MMKFRTSEILGRLVRRYGLLVLLTVLGAGAGIGYDVLKTPTYVAKSYVVVTAAAGDPQSAVNFAQAYGRIVTTAPVVSGATAILHSPAGLREVTASTSPDAPVIEITSTGTSAQHVADVANAMARSLVSYGVTQGTSTRVNLSVLAVAAVPASPASPKPPLEPAIGAAGGLLIGGLAVLAGVGNGTRRRVPADEPDFAVADAPEQPRAVAQLGQRQAAEVLPWTSDGTAAPHRTRAFAWYAGAGGPDDEDMFGPVADKQPARAQPAGTQPAGAQSAGGRPGGNQHGGQPGGGQPGRTAGARAKAKVPVRAKAPVRRTGADTAETANLALEATEIIIPGQLPRTAPPPAAASPIVIIARLEPEQPTRPAPVQDRPSLVGEPPVPPAAQQSAPPAAQQSAPEGRPAAVDGDARAAGERAPKAKPDPASFHAALPGTGFKPATTKPVVGRAIVVYHEPEQQ
jgi:capsular polysaccharide biosynthesis protein